MSVLRVNDMKLQNYNNCSHIYLHMCVCLGKSD